MKTHPCPDAPVSPPVAPAPPTAAEDDELFPHCVQFAALHPDLDAALLCNAFSIGRKRAKKLMKDVQSTRLRQGYAVASNVQHT